MASLGIHFPRAVLITWYSVLKGDLFENSIINIIAYLYFPGRLVKTLHVYMSMYVNITHPSLPGMSSLTLDPLAPIDVVLLYREQTTCMEAADKVKNLPTVKASNLKITQDTVHRLSMNVDRAALRSLWTLVLAEGSQLQPGLVGVSIDWSLTVWLTRGMKGRSPGSG